MSYKYVLEHKENKGQYIAKDFDTAFESRLPNGDVTEVENAMQFDDEYQLMCWSADGGAHRATMKVQFGEDAIVTLDIVEVLRSYRPIRVKE